MITRTDLFELAVFGHSTPTSITFQFTGFFIGRFNLGKKIFYLKTLVFIADPFHFWDCKYEHTYFVIIVYQFCYFKLEKIKDKKQHNDPRLCNLIKRDAHTVENENANKQNCSIFYF